MTNPNYHQPQKPINATLEPNTDNPDGYACTLYFDEFPTDDNVRDAFMNFATLFKEFNGFDAPLNLMQPLEFWVCTGYLVGFKYQALAI